MMEIRTQPFTISQWDLTKFALWNFYTNPVNLLFFAAFQFFGGGSLLFGILTSGQSINFFVIFIGLFGVPFALLHYTALWMVWRLATHKPAVFRSLIVGDNSISIKDDQGNIVKGMLSAYKRLVEFSDYYLLYGENRRYFLVPKSIFDPADLYIVDSIFKERIVH